MDEESGSAQGDSDGDWQSGSAVGLRLVRLGGKGLLTIQRRSQKSLPMDSSSCPSIELDRPRWGEILQLGLVMDVDVEDLSKV